MVRIQSAVLFATDDELTKMPPCFISYPHGVRVYCDGKLNFEYNLFVPDVNLETFSDGPTKLDKKERQALKYFSAFNSALQRRVHVLKNCDLSDEFPKEELDSNSYTFEKGVIEQSKELPTLTNVSDYLDPRIRRIFSTRVKDLVEERDKNKSEEKKKKSTLQSSFASDMSMVEVRMVYVFQKLLASLLTSQSFASWALEIRSTVPADKDSDDPPYHFEGCKLPPYLNFFPRTIVPTLTNKYISNQRVRPSYGLPRYPAAFQEVLSVIATSICHPRSRDLAATVFGQSFQGSKISREMEEEMGDQDIFPTMEKDVSTSVHRLKGGSTFSRISDFEILENVCTLYVMNEYM